MIIAIILNTVKEISFCAANQFYHYSKQRSIYQIHVPNTNLLSFCLRIAHHGVSKGKKKMRTFHVKVYTIIATRNAYLLYYKRLLRHRHLTNMLRPTFLAQDVLKYIMFWEFAPFLFTSGCDFIRVYLFHYGNWFGFVDTAHFITARLFHTAVYFIFSSVWPVVFPNQTRIGSGLCETWTEALCLGIWQPVDDAVIDFSDVSP